MFDLIQGRGRTVFASRDAVIYLFNIFRCLGVNPPDRYRIPYFFYSAIITIFSVLLSPILFSFAWLRDRNKLAVMEILNCLQISLNIAGLPFKSIALVMAQNHLRSIETILNKLDECYTGPEDKVKIRRCAIMGNRLVAGFVIPYLTYAALIAAAALVGGHAPLTLYIPKVDWRRSSWEYWLQAIYDITVSFFSTCHQACNDSYTAVYIYIIRTQIQLLSNRVKRLGYDENKSGDENYQELLECIVAHQEILKIVRIVKPVISFTVFTQFMIAAAVLGVTMVNIVVFADLPTKLTSAIYFYCVLLQTSPTCYHATYLQADCEDLCSAIFNCNWIAQNKRFNNLLIYFLHRAQDSIHLFAMKLVPINLATNVSIAKFSFTVFTFIQNMKLGDNLKG